MSGSTSSRLSYLDSQGLVCPEKIGDADSKKPVVLYTAKQIDQIRLIDQAAEYLSLDAIRLAINKKCLPQVVATLKQLLG